MMSNNHNVLHCVNNRPKCLAVNRFKDRQLGMNWYQKVCHINSRAMSWYYWGFLSAFAQGGAKWHCMDLGGKHIFVFKACGKLGASRGMLPRGNFDFGPFIRHNLVESGTVFAQTIYHLCVIKAVCFAGKFQRIVMLLLIHKVATYIT